MTVVTYPLGTPSAPGLRGGDCRARDLAQDRNVFGPHRFAASADCQIDNGMFRVSVAGAVTPTLEIVAYRGAIIEDDLYEDVYEDVYGGTAEPATWLDLGSVVIDSPVATAEISGVRLLRLTPESVSVRLVVDAVGDVVVRMRRGERMIHITHGVALSPVGVERRLRWIDDPSPAGEVVDPGRVQEAVMAPVPVRLVAALDVIDATTDAGDFALSTSEVATARFGAGVASAYLKDTPADLHSQLYDETLTRLAVT